MDLKEFKRLLENAKVEQSNDLFWYKEDDEYTTELVVVYFENGSNIGVHLTVSTSVKRIAGDYWTPDDIEETNKLEDYDDVVFFDKDDEELSVYPEMVEVFINYLCDYFCIED